MIDKITENYDLTEREAKVYLAGLSKGKSKVSEIAKAAELNRITTYEILKRLASKGLAGGVTYGKITYFKVINPEAFISKKERQLSLAKGLLPYLTSIKNSSAGRPKIEFYDGVEGIKAVFESALSCKDKIIYDMANAENMVNVLDKTFIDDYCKRRAKKKIRVKVLIPKKGAEDVYLKDDAKVLRESKVFDSAKFDIPNEIMVFDNKVTLISFSGKMAVTIEDKEISDSIRSIWKLLWNSLK
ncbi:MAG: helix-turn-helix domain-containing protein [Patescibacteria group bacterium]